MSTPNPFSEIGYQTGFLVKAAVEAGNADTSAKLDAVLDILSDSSDVATAPSSVGSTITPAITPTTATQVVLVVDDPDRGVSADDGRVLAKAEHIRQSLMNIFTTPIGSLVMRRDYGSLIPSLVDAPLNESTLLRIVHAAAEAALRWEQRLSKLLLVVIDVTSNGKLRLGIIGQDEDGNELRYEEVAAS